jgi:hypothetical protein
MHPVVSRYLAREHVEHFFNDGVLRIPSFGSFRCNPDEHRGDVLEGRITAELRGPNVRHSVVGWNGQAAVVLCGTSAEHKGMERTFGCKSGIRILDIVGFAEIISRHIPEFVRVLHGNCVYRDDAVLRKPISNRFEPPGAAEDMEAWGTGQDILIAQQIEEGYFIKRSKYAAQREYRVIWFAGGVESNDAIFVTCPEARSVCQPF